MVTKSGGTITKAEQYPIKQGTRRDRLLLDWVYAVIARAGEEKFGKWDDYAKGGVQEMPAELYVALSEGDEVSDFALVIIYTDRSNSSKAQLVSDEGLQYSVPSFDAEPTALVDAYWRWLCTNEQLTKEIVERIKTSLLSQTERHLAPPKDLTEEERADPN